LIIRFLLVYLLVFFFALGFRGGCECNNHTTSPNHLESKPERVKAISPNYCLLASTNFKNFIDMVAKYKANALKIFNYCGWDIQYYPWSGSMDNLLWERLENLRTFIDYANAKGIWVILTMFQDNAGGGTEDILSKDKNMLAKYIQGIVEATKGRMVIYETSNEIANTDFQKWVLNELKKYEVITASYQEDIGADYVIYHTLSQVYIGGGRVHSNDVAGYPSYYTFEGYKNIIDSGGSFEFLTYWDDKGNQLKTPEAQESFYGEVLRYLQNVP